MTQLGASRLQGLQGIHLGGLVGEEARVAGVGHDGRALPGDQARPVFQGGVAGRGRWVECCGADKSRVLDAFCSWP